MMHLLKISCHFVSYSFIGFIYRIDMENLDAEEGSDVVLQTDWIILERKKSWIELVNINFLVSFMKRF